jgi:hypothetical protein
MTLCKLCIRPSQEVGPIRRSHTIPKFLLKKSKGQDGRFVRFRLDTKQIDLAQGDWAEDMLCDGCELKIKSQYEDFLNEILFLRRKTVVLEKGRHHTWLRGSTDRLALAAMSIFWRATVADDPIFRLAVLPDYAREELRQWVLSCSLPRNWSDLITVGIQRLVNNDGETISLFISPFVRNHVSQFEFVFVCGGFMFSFFVPPRPNQVYARTTAIKPRSHTIRIKNLDFLAVEEIRDAIDWMIETQKSDAFVKGMDAFRSEKKYPLL